jgi:hypothetical protein
MNVETNVETKCNSINRIIHSRNHNCLNPLRAVLPCFSSTSGVIGFTSGYRLFDLNPITPSTTVNVYMKRSVRGGNAAGRHYANYINSEKLKNEQSIYSKS